MQTEQKSQAGKVFRLCYVRFPWVFFTELEDVRKQDGYRWDTEVYADPARGDSIDPMLDPIPYTGDGLPYGERKYHEIVKIAIDGEFFDPTHRLVQLKVSPTPKRINHRWIPWLVIPGDNDEYPTHIWAGTKLEDFIKIIEDNGGKVYFEKE